MKEGLEGNSRRIVRFIGPVCRDGNPVTSSGKLSDD